MQITHCKLFTENMQISSYLKKGYFHSLMKCLLPRNHLIPAIRRKLPGLFCFRMAMHDLVADVELTKSSMIFYTQCIFPIKHLRIFTFLELLKKHLTTMRVIQAKLFFSHDIRALVHSWKNTLTAGVITLKNKHAHLQLHLIF